MLCAGKTTAWLPTTKTPPFGLTVNCAVPLRTLVPERDRFGRLDGASIAEPGAVLGATEGATTALSEHPVRTPMTRALATTTQ